MPELTPAQIKFLLAMLHAKKHALALGEYPSQTRREQFQMTEAIIRRLQNA